MSILFKVAAVCFVLTVVNYVLTRVMVDSMSDTENVRYYFNDIVPKRVAFFIICMCLSFTAMCVSLMGAIIMM
jgi:hypothetical protein